MATKNAMSWVDDLTWQSLQAKLRESSEDEVLKMLNHERKHRRRLQFLMRMHACYNKMRATRERNALAVAASE